MRSDAIIATGRSDYPNQINNVLAFPGIFRGAFDAGATAITEGMNLAAATALAGLVGADLADDLPDAIVLATGGTLIEAIRFLYQRGAARVTCLCLLGAPEGIGRLEASLGDVEVDLYLAAVDERLDERSYIVPGLGDAGDRLYGTK